MNRHLFIGLVLALLAASPVKAQETSDTAALKAKAARNDTAAQFSLGWRYYEGVGAPVNYKESAKWLKKAAAHGHAQAQYYLGVLYEYGRGVSPDYAAARRWFLKSANQNNPQALAAMAGLYQNAWGVKRDMQEACFWFMLSSVAIRLPDAPSCTIVSGELSAQQIAKTHERAQNWLLQHHVKPPARSTAKPESDG
jgi:TPR repeat protein